MSTYDQIIQKGEEQGIEKGKIEGKIEVAINAFANGLSIQLIANITGLEESEVTRVLKEHGML